MEILILGGTIFLGRYLVETALERGHKITLFNRGQHNSELFPTVEKLPGNRDGNLEALKNRRWDAAIDTSGYFPRLVGDSARLLAGVVDHYTFISSISVYDGFSQVGMDETAPVGKLENEKIEEITGETYGPLKALCERTAEEVMPGRVLTVRPGLIVGPHDPTDRFTYWPHRVAKGGPTLAPGRPERPIQFIDARDLAAWIIALVENRLTGTFNANGPDYELSMGRFLEEGRLATGSNAELIWVDDKTMEKAGLTPWIEIPLWVPETEENAGFFKIDCSKAIKAGLVFRTVAETFKDTQDWDGTRPPGIDWRAGLKPEKEAEVLKQWGEAKAQV